MIANVTLALATPLANLRGYWLEMRCCGGPKRSPLWFHAALRPGWLLSDLGLDHSCPSCGTTPALHAAIAVPDIGCMHNSIQQQALRIDEDVPLLAFDLLAAIKARQIDLAHPFSALLTL